MRCRSHNVNILNAVTCLNVGCMLCVERASSVLDLGQVLNTLRLSHTLRTMHAGFQDLCVKVESTAGLVMLVTDNQRDEELVKRAVKEKLLMDVQKNASKLEVYVVCGAINVPLCCAYCTCGPCSGVLLISAACVVPCMCAPVLCMWVCTVLAIADSVCFSCSLEPQIPMSIWRFCGK
jgi:hypothetical protein